MGQSSVEMMQASKAPDSFSSIDGVALDCHTHCSHHSRNISALGAQTLLGKQETETPSPTEIHSRNRNEDVLLQQLWVVKAKRFFM